MEERTFNVVVILFWSAVLTILAVTFTISWMAFLLGIYIVGIPIFFGFQIIAFLSSGGYVRNYAVLILWSLLWPLYLPFFLGMYIGSQR